MKHLVVIAMIGLVLSGCSREAQRVSGAALRVWRSPDSSLTLRVQAASELLPKGTKMGDAATLLGEPTRRERWHGIRILDSGTSKPEDCDEDHYIYEFSADEIVRLRFNGFASPSSWRDRPLIDIKSGHANDIKIISTKEVQR